MDYLERYKEDGLKCARGIADWLCMSQYAHHQFDPRAGTCVYFINEDGNECIANNWNLAFSIMGLLSAYEVFGEKRYKKSAFRMGNYLKSLQIFDPFKKRHYGAIREISPQTPWCYTRDALSAAWGFLELYRNSDDREFLDRAVLWAEWFIKNGIDEDGWPLWGVQFEPYFENQIPQMRNDIQGSFQGGSLNFFYQLAKETGDSKWTGDFFLKIANYFVDYVQQEDGLFRSIDRITKKTPGQDPQNGLHRANDDLGTIGLCCAYKISKNKKYLSSIYKFMKAVFKAQLNDGNFEESAAAIPVVLNSWWVIRDQIDTSFIAEDNIVKALKALFERQSNGSINPKTKGGIIEYKNNMAVYARSSCYSLIFLTKIFGNVNKFLKV